MPAALRRLWGLDVRSPQARPGLSATLIVRTAIELADAGGLEAVSMSRLAQRLGYTTMSLYRYVANKDELLVLMHDAAWQPSEAVAATLAGQGTPPAASDGNARQSDAYNPGQAPDAGGWRLALARWCRAQRDVLRAHPWLEGIRVTERMGTPSQLYWMDSGLRALAGTPLGEYEKSQALLLLNGLVFWDARIVADFTDALRATGLSMDQIAAGYGQALRSLADPQRFPALRRAIDEGAFDPPEMARYTDVDADFTFGLECVLDGIEQLIARAGEPPNPP